MRVLTGQAGHDACATTLVLVVSLWAATAAAQAVRSAQDLRRLSIEELMNIEVTTVARGPQESSLAPAAVHVITRDDIRRSGATSVPEALRLAPGVHVARVDANKYAIGIRGFTDRLARSMLVLIDGRAVYSPLFAGTYWEVQDLLLEDVDRIEVIRGPGGTLWGANAVNGIVNIISKRAADTHGTFVTAGTGTQERALLAARHGGRHGDTLHYRGYIKAFDRAAEWHPDDRAYDQWRMAQGGFRLDWQALDTTTPDFTLQGDLYTGYAGQRSATTAYAPPSGPLVDGDTQLSGGNLLARWNRQLTPRTDVRLQAYYDRTNREETTFLEHRDTFDVDFQQSLAIADGHRFTWGAAYRASSGHTVSGLRVRFDPLDRTDTIASGFVQQETTLFGRRLHLTLGAKLERNAYSGFEAQPAARLVWSPVPEHGVVLSVSRAVRTPTRVERDLELTSLSNPALPLYVRLLPNDAFTTESVVAYEAGYRVRPVDRLYVTLSTFVNDHRDVLSTEAAAPFVETMPPPARLVLPIQFANGLHGNSHGLELTTDARFTPWWRWTTTYSFLRVQLTRDADSRDQSQERRGEGLTPGHQFRSQVSLDFGPSWTADWQLRAIGAVPVLGVPAYATSDVRLAYRARRGLELAVIGRNLHQASHLEFSGGAVGDVRIRRSLGVTLGWWF